MLTIYLFLKNLGYLLCFSTRLHANKYPIYLNLLVYKKGRKKKYKCFSTVLFLGENFGHLKWQTPKDLRSN